MACKKCNASKKHLSLGGQAASEDMRVADRHAEERLRLHLLESLDQAIEERWIYPVYQAIVRAASGVVCGEEALARWRDPEYGELLPCQFVDVLEEAGLSHKLDLHIVDCVLADIVSKRERGVPIVPVSVNFSLQDLCEISVAHEIARRADAWGISHDLVCVELTESSSLSDYDVLDAQITLLRELGFKVWMDDFGSGCSSLNILNKLNFDAVKLDMGLVRSSNEGKARIIVASVIQTAAKLGVGTLAEGIESEEQALFLAGIGCDMLQGYYYATPHVLDEDALKAVEEGDLPCEPSSEMDYWDVVSEINLDDVSANEGGERVDGLQVSAVPTGVIERREGMWRLLRANVPYREFLDQAGLLPCERSGVGAHPIEGSMDIAFVMAADRSVESGTWERVGGRLEYGTGLQFYVKRMASAQHAEAFMVTAVPTMLGTALGAYGDVPVAYAVFKVVLNDEADEVVDAEYVFANDMYCEWGGFDPKAIIGKSFLATYPNASTIWFPYCYRAAVLGEHVHDIIFSPEAGHWLTFYLSPCPMKGYCVYAFAIADDERREREDILKSRDTSDLIIAITDAMSGEESYDVAMNNLLETMSHIIHPDRLYIYERGRGTENRVFEWCIPGFNSHCDRIWNPGDARLRAWDGLMGENSFILIPDVEEMRDLDSELFGLFKESGVTRTLAVPLRNGDELMGYFGADNYELDSGFDSVRLLKTVASFVGARMANRRLMASLERMGLHDGLTQLLNRRGVDLAIGKHLQESPEEPYALALMDVDDFKTINDLYGHDVGDEALRSLAQSVREAFPPQAVLGRNGGDEFLVMLFGEDAQRADDLIAAFARRELWCVWKGRRYELSMSVGYAVYPQDVQNLQDAYSKVDAALYAVKLEGKGGYKRYTDNMEVSHRSQLGFTPRNIADNIPGGIVVHEPGDGKILYANDELVDLFECESLKEFMEHTGGTFGGIIHPDDRQRVREELAAQMTFDDVGCTDFVDYRIVTKRGNVRPVSNRGRLVRLDGVGDVFYELVMSRLRGNVSHGE